MVKVERGGRILSLLPRLPELERRDDPFTEKGRR